MDQHQIYGLHLPGESIRYVGLTSAGVEKRLQGHRYAALGNGDYPVNRWMRKHGPENVRAIVIYTAETRGELGDLEIDWIDRLNTHVSRGGLNATLGGRVYDNVGRAKISAANSRRIISDETRRKISEANRGGSHGAHVRWHEKRDRIDEFCKWCVDDPSPRPLTVRAPSRAEGQHERYHVRFGGPKPGCEFCDVAQA